MNATDTLIGALAGGRYNITIEHGQHGFHVELTKYSRYSRESTTIVGGNGPTTEDALIDLVRDLVRDRHHQIEKQCQPSNAAADPAPSSAAPPSGESGSNTSSSTKTDPKTTTTPNPQPTVFGMDDLPPRCDAPTAASATETQTPSDRISYDEYRSRYFSRIKQRCGELSLSTRQYLHGLIETINRDSLSNHPEQDVDRWAADKLKT